MGAEEPEPERLGAAGSPPQMSKVEVGWPDPVEERPVGALPISEERAPFPRLDVGDDRVFLDSTDDPTASLTGPADEPVTEDPGNFRILD